MSRTSLLAYGLVALLLFSVVPVRGVYAEDVPWHAPVEPVDRPLLDRLLSADEAAREAAAKEWEEARLAERYPEYRAYAAATPRFVPWPARTAGKMDPT